MDINHKCNHTNLLCFIVIPFVVIFIIYVVIVVVVIVFIIVVIVFIRRSMYIVHHYSISYGKCLDNRTHAV